MRIIKDAGHNDWPMLANEVLWKEIMEFVSANPS